MPRLRRRTANPKPHYDERSDDEDKYTDDESESDYKPDDMHDSSEEESDDDLSVELDDDEESGSEMEATSSKRRAATPPPEKSKKAKYKHTDPIKIGNEPHQDLYRLLAETLSLTYYDVRAYLSSISVKNPVISTIHQHPECDDAMKKKIKNLINNMNKSSQLSDVTPQNALENQVKGKGNPSFDNKLNELQTELHSDSTNHEKITLVNKFLNNHTFIQLDDYLAAAYEANPNKDRYRAIEHVFISIFATLKANVDNISALQLNQLYFLIIPVVRCRNSELLTEKNAKKGANRHKNQSSLFKAGRAAVGLTPQSSRAENLKGSSGTHSRVETAEKAFNQRVDNPIYDFFAEIGYSFYDVEIYILRLYTVVNQGYVNIGNHLVQLLKEDHEFLDEAKLVTDYAAIEKKFKPFVKNMIAAYNANADESTSQKIKTILGKNRFKKSGDKDLETIISKLDKTSITELQLSQLGINQPLLITLINESFSSTYWRNKKELRDYAYIFSKLFAEICKKFPDASASQLNQLHKLLAPKVISLRITKLTNIYQHKRYQHEKGYAKLAETIFNSKGVASAQAHDTDDEEDHRSVSSASSNMTP